MIGAEIQIYGLVQGVGYRYFCYQKATALGLTGWVKNLSDGSVALQVEGEKSVITDYIQYLESGPAHASVEKVTVHWTESSGKFHSFQIAR